MKHLRIITVAVLIGMLLPQFSGAVWFDTNWSNKFSITSDETSVAENLTNYPAYYDCANAPAGFWTTVKEDGSDIRITSSTEDGTLFHELVAISTSSQTCEIHFDTVSLSSSSADTFYIYYGNAGASSISTSTTWNSNFAAVYHLQDDPASGAGNELIDSTSNNNDGNTATMDSNDLVDGQMGKGWDFDGTSDYASSTDIDWTTITISAWTNWDDFTSDRYVFSKQTSPASADKELELNAGGGGANLILNVPDTSGNNFDIWSPHSLSTTAFRLLVGTADDTNNDTHLYVDADVKTDTDSNMTTHNNLSIAFYFGARLNSGTVERFFDGVMDEVRIMTIEQSVGEILTTFNNQASSTAFFAAGAEEGVPTVNNIGGIRMGFSF